MHSQPTTKSLRFGLIAARNMVGLAVDPMQGLEQGGEDAADEPAEDGRPKKRAANRM